MKEVTAHLLKDSALVLIRGCTAGAADQFVNGPATGTVSRDEWMTGAGATALGLGLKAIAAYTGHDFFDSFGSGIAYQGAGQLAHNTAQDVRNHFAAAAASSSAASTAAANQQVAPIISQVNFAPAPLGMDSTDPFVESY